MKKLLLVLLSVLLITPVFAQGKYSIKEMTPQVEEALNNRKERFEALKSFKASGIIGENNKGYVQVLKSNGDAALLVDAENKDRKVIYKTIAEQNGLADALGTIENVFGQVQRTKAEMGEKIQQEDGSWVMK